MPATRPPDPDGDPRAARAIRWYEEQIAVGERLTDARMRARLGCAPYAVDMSMAEVLGYAEDAGLLVYHGLGDYGRPDPAPLTLATVEALPELPELDLSETYRTLAKTWRELVAEMLPEVRRLREALAAAEERAEACLRGQHANSRMAALGAWHTMAERLGVHLEDVADPEEAERRVMARMAPTPWVRKPTSVAEPHGWIWEREQPHVARVRVVQWTHSHDQGCDLQMWQEQLRVWQQVRHYRTPELAQAAADELHGSVAWRKA
jgi:hypothetical protein